MERTTDLNELKKGKPYTWGKVVKIHEIGPYSIVEYIPWTENEDGVITESVDPKSDHNYSCYIDSEDVQIITENLDHALVASIAYLHEGDYTSAPEYFMRMIDNC